MSSDWKVAWVTGASSGIGLELAKRLAARKITVAASARSEDKLVALAKENSYIQPWPLDVSDAVATLTALAEIEKTYGPIDLAVLNAGIWQPLNAKDFDGKKLRQMMDVNYMGVVNCLDGLLPRLYQRGTGHIAIVGSVAAYRGLPKAIAYGPTKAALNNLAEAMKLDLDRAGIKLQIINPGFVDTPMLAKSTFPMPFIMPAGSAADIILKGLESNKFEIAFPAFFAWMLRSGRHLPHSVFYWFYRTFFAPGRGRARE
jgi:short-subunit dehydrogenase